MLDTPIKSTEIGRAWVEYLAHILNNGSKIFDSREDILEVGPLHFVINDFSDKENIILREGNEHITEIYRAKMFSREIIPELNSTYGDRFFDNLGFDQIADTLKRLRENPWSKSCFIPLVVPNDPGPRIPCLSAVQFAIRGNKILLFATFRSQNAFNSYGNFYGLRDLQQFMARELGKDVGDIFFTVNFPHIYFSDIQESKDILARNSLY